MASNPSPEPAKSLREAATHDPVEAFAAMNDSPEDQEAISRLAYEFYEERGRPGYALEDWLRAEKEVRSRGSSS